MTHDSPADRDQAITAARHTARNATLNLSRDTGAQTITRPLYPGAATTSRDIKAIAGLRAGRELKLAARHIARDDVRNLRAELIGLVASVTVNHGVRTGARSAYFATPAISSASPATRWNRLWADA